jgi:hypothetical protein
VEIVCILYSRSPLDEGKHSPTKGVAMSATATKTSVEVTYNGIVQELAYQPHEQVNALLQRAVHAFGITANAHLFSLFRENGQELADNESIEAAGVEPGDLLVLRQSVVKGG